MDEKRQPENCFRIDPDRYDGNTLYVYPVSQIHMDGHPEIAQHLSVTKWGHEDLMLEIKHPLGTTSLKVNSAAMYDGLTTYLGRGNNDVTGLLRLIQEARETGTRAATYEEIRKERGQHDSSHHLGDDTGDLITLAYRHSGAEASAEIIYAYLESFNRKRSVDGISPLSPTNAVRNLVQAIKPERGITRAEQEEVAAAFIRLYGSRP